jgi:Flp pilus assembly protein TadD
VPRRTLRTLPLILAWLLLPSAAAAQGTCTAEGFVFDGEGNPVPDVQVLLQYKGHNPQRYRTRTDRKGKFVHVNVYEGPYDITFAKEGQGEVTVKDFRIREIPSLEKAPIFRLGGVQQSVAPAPGLLPAPGSGADALDSPTASGASPGSAPAGPAPAAAASPAGAPAGPAPPDVAALAAELQKGDAALTAGRTDEAIATYQAVLAQVPTSAPVHHNLGLAYKRKGELAQAEAEFRKAAELQPAFAAPHGALSVMLAAGGKLDEAVAQAREAVQDAPSDAQYAYNLGVLLKDTGQAGDAKQALLKAEALDPANVEIQFHLGTVELGLGQMAEATARLEKYLAAAPASAPNVATAKGIIAALSKRK